MGIKGGLHDFRTQTQLKRYRKSNPRVAQTVDGVKRQNLTFLHRVALDGLAITARNLDRRHVEGAIIEAGTALGGSAIVLAAAKSPQRRLVLYDTFGLIPPPSDKDGADVHERYAVIESGKSTGIGGETYYGYRDDLLGEITASFDRFGLPVSENSVEFVQGLYEEAMFVDFPVALAHVDCDWYDSVTVCLERIAPHLVSGGRFVIDDYASWSGARQATDDFIQAHADEFTLKWRFGRVHLIKRR